MNDYVYPARVGSKRGYWVHWLPRLVTDHTFWPIRKVRVYYLVNCDTAEEEEFRDFNSLQSYIKQYHLYPIYYTI